MLNRCLGRQFDAFTPLDSVHVNGKLTMDENLAVLGRLTIAYGSGTGTTT
jgi:putative endopeptidase